MFAAAVPWTSYGSDQVNDQYIRYTPTSTPGYDIYETNYIDRYRHGIKVLFQPHGQLGQVSMVKITETILQGVVLFGMATTITTFIASYLGGYVFAGSFSKIFRNYQMTTV